MKPVTRQKAPSTENWRLEPPSSASVLTYKRRKRSSSAAAAVAAPVTLAEDKGFVEQSSQDDRINRDRLARTEINWRKLLSSILHCSDSTEHCDGLAACVNDALSRNIGDVNLQDHNSQPEQAQCNAEEQERRRREPDGHGGGCGVKTKYQNVFSDILCSEKFALLCDLLSHNFDDSGYKRMLDFGIINANMKNGIYDGSPVLFCKDVQQMWERFQQIGQEMFLLSTDLIDISRDSFQKQVGKDWVHETTLRKSEEVFQFQACNEEKNQVNSWVSTPLANGSEHSSKPDLTEASCHEVQTCKSCGGLADEQNIIVCDGCEGIYHISCAHPSFTPSDRSNWYCSSCVTTKEGLSQHPVTTSADAECLHQNCIVCERLGISHGDGHGSKTDDGYKTTRSDSRESSVSSMEADGPPELSQTALGRLCKQCGTSEDETGLFLICGHALCLYKFYHIKCLKSNQIASENQEGLVWYCPSCLCRVCLCDKDDDKIVMCDGCDEAYHIYCMHPPLDSIPKGNWYCVPCNVKRVMKAMRNYEQSILQMHGSKEAWQENGAIKTLLCAAKELNLRGGGGTAT